jgi:response regulator of citrate/malate metabolism
MTIVLRARYARALEETWSRKTQENKPIPTHFKKTMGESDKKFSGLQILILEDDLSFQQLLMMRLGSFFPDSHFFTFTTLNKARIALETEAVKPDLAILDHNLPDGSGTKLLKEGLCANVPVLSISSDEAPDIPAVSLGAGAAFFLCKSQISDALLKPLLEAMLERAKLEAALKQALVDSTIVDTVRTLVTTLRHEIHNPLGAVIGAAHLIANSPVLSEDQRKAADLVSQSGHRIQEVLHKLAETTSHESISQASTTVFKIQDCEEILQVKKNK